MSKIIFAVLAALVLVLGNPAPSEARGHGHGHFGVDLWLGPVWGPWAWGPYPYYGNPYYSAPVVIEKQQPLYVEPQPREQYYWYYCPNAKGYYPYVSQCPEGWIKVIPSTKPPGQK